jgi:hypothetical protein
MLLHRIHRVALDASEWLLPRSALIGRLRTQRDELAEVCDERIRLVRDNEALRSELHQAEAELAAERGDLA